MENHHVSLENSQFVNWKMAIEIVSLPIVNGGSFHSFLYMCARGELEDVLYDVSKATKNLWHPFMWFGGWLISALLTFNTRTHTHRVLPGLQH